MISWPRSPKDTALSHDDIRQYKAGLNLLNNIRHPGEASEEWIQFVSLILFACKKAIAWKPALAESVYRLADYNEFNKDLPSIRNALGKLINFSQKHQYKFDVIAAYAQDRVGLTAENIFESGLSQKLRLGRDWGLPLIRNMLEALADELERPRAEIRSRYLIRWNGDEGLRMLRVAGPLCFPEIAEGRKLPDLRLTGLQFELSFLLRRYTAGLPTRPIARGDDIPPAGRPCHPIVAEFVRSSILPDFSDDKGQAFLKVLRQNRGPDGKGIVWSRWGVEGMAEAPGGRINLRTIVA